MGEHRGSGEGAPQTTEARPKCWEDPGIRNRKEEEKWVCPLTDPAGLLDLTRPRPLSPGADTKQKPAVGRRRKSTVF